MDLNRGSQAVWLLIPLIYFLGWWQTGSFRQAFNGTIAWIIGYAIAAGTILFLDVGGYSGIAATPDSPGAGLAILGGFIGMWTSNIIWRRRGGDPPRKPGKWERSILAMLGKDKQPKKKKRPATQQQPPRQAPPPRQPAGPAPLDAQFRPAPGSAPPTQQPQQQAGPAPQQAAPAQSAPSPQFQQAHDTTPPAGQYPPAQQPAPTRKKRSSRNSPTADKYAKATGRALGAMFRGPTKKKSTNSPNQ